MVFENDDIFDDNANVYFLMKEQYFELFVNYNGKVRILKYNHNKYKWNIFYRINLLKKLNSLKLKTVYNITAARGFLNDEITLLCGAQNKFTTCNSWRYLKEFWGSKMNKGYTKILFQNEKNEYKKNILLLKCFSKNEPETINKKVFDIKKYSNYLSEKGYRKGNYIVVSPLSSDMSKSWGIENYKNLCLILKRKYKIVLMGSPKEYKTLKYISNDDSDISLHSYSLEYVPAVIGNSKLFVGNDSGLTHVALKLNIPLVAILYGGYFKMFLPFKENVNKFVYLYNEMDCFGCHSRCIYKEPLCLKNLKVNNVLGEVEKLL